MDKKPIGIATTWAQHMRGGLRFATDVTDAEWVVLAPLLPPCFPPRQTVYGWFATWRDAGVWQSINHHLVMLDREHVGREASPSAAVIDSQSVKTTEAGGRCGYDARKKIKG